MGEAEKNDKMSKSEKVGLGKRVKDFFHGVKAEFKKIIWPDKEDTVKQSIAVLAVSVVVGVVIALLDMAIQYGVNFLV